VKQGQTGGHDDHNYGHLVHYHNYHGRHFDACRGHLTMMTPRQYVLFSVLTYPSLYASPSYEESARMVFDQLFNTIGNGIRDHDELIESLTRPIPDDLEAQTAKFLTGEPCFYGYFEMRDYGDFKMPEGDSIVCVESDKANHPEVVYWVNCRYCPFSPYSNFSEQYSIIYRSDFISLSNDWRNAAKWFYEQSRDFFNSERIASYHGYFGDGSSNDDKNRISDFNEWIQYDFVSGKYKTFDDVSKAYGIKFTGYYNEFLRSIWDRELARITQFIDKTIVMLS
jgi:hypothetical protein